MTRNPNLLLATGVLLLACSESAHQASSEQLLQTKAALTTPGVELDVYTDWSTGHCAFIDYPEYPWDGSYWHADIDLRDSQVSTTWNGAFDVSGSPMKVTGQYGSPGFCANKTGPNWQPQLAQAPDPDPEIDLSACPLDRV